MAGSNLLGTGQDLDASSNTVIAQFKLLEDEGAVCRTLASKLNLEPGEGPTKYIDSYDRLAVYALQEAVDMGRAQAMADTRYSYSPSEFGGMVVIPWTTARRTADRSIERNAGTMLRRAFNLKEDQDGTAQFPSWTPIVGSAGTILSPGMVAAAEARLGIGNNRSNPEPWPGEHVGVFHSLQLHHLAMKLVPLSNVPSGSNVYTGLANGDAIGPGRTSMSDDILRNGVEAVGMMAGVKIYRDSNIAVDSSDDGSGAVFSREGFIYIRERAPEIDSEYRKTLRATTHLVVGNYTFGLYRSSSSGCEVLADCSLPTA